MDAENLGDREQLHVHFAPDQQFVFGQDFGADRGCGGHKKILARVSEEISCRCRSERGQ
jgi:hypothetical protein